MWGTRCLCIAPQTLQPHFEEHNWFSTGIQTCAMIELRDGGDLVPEKLCLAREITALTWRAEKMFPGQWGWLTDIRWEEIEGLAKFRDKMLFLTVRSSCRWCSSCSQSTTEAADWTECGRAFAKSWWSKAPCVICKWNWMRIRGITLIQGALAICWLTRSWEAQLRMSLKVGSQSLWLQNDRQCLQDYTCQSQVDSDFSKAAVYQQLGNDTVLKYSLAFQRVEYKVL